MNIPIVSNVVKYYFVFYGYVGKRLLLLVVLVFLAGLSESFGLSMLLPLLNMGNPESSIGAYTKFIHRLIETLGLEVSLYSVLLFIFIAFSCKGIFTFVQTAIYAIITANLSRDLQIRMTTKYAQMNYGYYVNSNIGYLNNIITKEIDRALLAFHRYVTVLVFMVYIILYLCVAFAINWMMSSIVIIFSSFLFMLFRSFSTTLRKLSLFISQMNASIQATLIQVIYNFKYLKATQSFQHLNIQLKSKITNLRNAILRLEVIKAVPHSAIEPLTVLFLSGVIISQVEMLGKPLAGSFILLVFFYKTFIKIFAFQIEWQHFCSYVGGIEVLEKADIDIDKNSETQSGKAISDFEHQIVFQNVNFNYSNRHVLTDVNMVIPKNKTIGIVGESGSGKTTIFDLITGLATPQSGAIFFDNIDYRKIKLESIRKMIGYVTQDPVVFNDSIANNISFWNCDYKDIKCRDQVKRVSQLANCSEFIEESRDGYQTQIGDKGVKLSGGQRQRIAIARELFKEPTIMIFDEATSSLDTESEKYIQNSIDSMMGKCTIIIIAHRLSTIKNCDYIYVLSKGKIVEEGKFSELISIDNGIFRKMCIAQQI